MSTRESTGSSKKPPRCRDASWVYVGLGVSNIVSGFLVGVVYFSVRTFTTSTELTEVIPTYVNAIMAVCCGIITLFVYKRRDKLLLCASIVLCLLTAALCAASGLLVGLEVIRPMLQYAGCSYDDVNHKCACYISNDTFSSNVHHERDFVYENTRNCRVIEKNLLEFVYMAEGLYILLFIINTLSFIVASAECRRASLFNRLEQENYLTTNIECPPFSPILGLHELEALRILENWDPSSSELLQYASSSVNVPRSMNRCSSNDRLGQQNGYSTSNMDEDTPPVSNDILSHESSRQTGQSSRSEERSPRSRTSVVSRQVVLPGDNIPRLLGIRRLDGLPQGTLSIGELESQSDGQERENSSNESGDPRIYSGGSNESSRSHALHTVPHQHNRQLIENVENERRQRQNERPNPQNSSTPILDPVYTNHLTSLWNLQLLQLLRYRQSMAINQYDHQLPVTIVADGRNGHSERNNESSVGALRRQGIPLSRRHSDIVSSSTTRPTNNDQRRFINRTFSTSLGREVHSPFSNLPEELPPPYSVLPSRSNAFSANSGALVDEFDRETVDDSESLIQQRPRNTRPWVRRILSPIQMSSRHQSRVSGRMRRSRPPLAQPSRRRENNRTLDQSNQFRGQYNRSDDSFGSVNGPTSTRRAPSLANRATSIQSERRSRRTRGPSVEETGI